MDNDNNQQVEVSLPIEEVGNRIGGFLFVVIILSVLPYIAIHGIGYFKAITLTRIAVLLLMLVGGIVLHELIHALFFGLFSKGGMRSISFGIDKKTLSPYCHCKGDMSVMVYRMGALAPMVVLGLLPLVYAWITGSPLSLIFGLIYSIAAGGDWVAVTLTSGLHMRDIIRDHPSKLGFFIVKKHVTNL